jgi:hypothetical protein
MFSSMRKIQHVVPFLLLLSGCAVRQTGPRTWRFAERTLIPPGVSSPDLPENKFTAPITVRRDCLASEPLTVRRRRSAITVTVRREALLRQARGWLTEFVDRAESAGCIPAGQGAMLAARILEAVPLPAGAAVRLLRGENRYNFVELFDGNRLQVISPLLREGVTTLAAPSGAMQVSGAGNRIDVTMQSSPDLIGVETAWYDIRPKGSGRGSAIVPVSVQTYVNGQVEDRAAPVKTYFQFPPEIGYYRLFYKADDSEVLALASTHAGLPADPDMCDRPGGPACFMVPRGVGVNPYMRIEVNGKPLTVPINATVRSVLQAAKEKPEAVLPTLAIVKPFAGRPVPVEFDRAKQDILNLVLMGDEQIRW